MCHRWWVIKRGVLFQDEKCPYPCQCPAMGEECGECEECPRQMGEPCSEDKPCDMQRGLICRYRHGDSEGVCRGKRVNNRGRILDLQVFFHDILLWKMRWSEIEIILRDFQFIFLFNFVKYLLKYKGFSIYILLCQIFLKNKTKLFKKINI